MYSWIFNNAMFKIIHTLGLPEAYIGGGAAGRNRPPPPPPHENIGEANISFCLITDPDLCEMCYLKFLHIWQAFMLSGTTFVIERYAYI